MADNAIPLQIPSKDIPQLITEAQLLADLYQEWLYKLVRLRVDRDMFNSLMITEATNQEVVKSSAENNKAIERTEKLLSIITEHYIKAIGNLKGDINNGEKH